MVVKSEEEIRILDDDLTILFGLKKCHHVLLC